MKRKPIGISLLGLLFVASASTTALPQTNQMLLVKFDDDGTQFSCVKLDIQLEFSGTSISREYSDGKFLIPGEVLALDKSQPVDVTVTCDGHSAQFPSLPASWLRSGYWNVGIDYPPFRTESRRSPSIEKGAWLSYIEFEPDGYDGVVTAISHPEVPQELLSRLRNEQPTASGARARDIAYALAVFKDNYNRNRDYLLQLLKTCADRGKGSPQDAVCDDDLLDFVTNLYWRGDESLLQPLLTLPVSLNDSGYDLGTFYSDVLDRHPTSILHGLHTLTPEHRQDICKMAGKDDLSTDGPKLKRVEKGLSSSTDDLAKPCLQAAKQGAGRAH